MIIKTIERSASREYNIFGLKEWKGARMVAEINETEDEYECGKELERKVERQLSVHTVEPIAYSETLSFFHRDEAGATKPAFDVREVHRYTDITPPPVIDRKAIERLEILIDDAKAIEELAIYKEDASKHGLVEQYMSKLKSLQ